jgi:hypothetical protein
VNVSLSDLKSKLVSYIELIFDESNEESPENLSKLKDDSKSDAIGMSFQSQKNFPPKSKVCRDDSSLFVTGSQLNLTGFSNFLGDNPLLKYYDCSTKMSNSPIKEPSPIKRIGNNENINNTYLNMNVNMNVVSPPSNTYFMPNIQLTNPNVTPLSKTMKYMPQQVPNMYQDIYNQESLQEDHQQSYNPYEQHSLEKSQFRNFQFNPNLNPYSTRNNRHMNQMHPRGQMDAKNSIRPSFMDFDDNDLAKYSYNLAKDQAGCRYLQKRIDDNPDIVNALIYPNVTF